MKDRTSVSTDIVTCTTRMSFLDDEGPGVEIDADLVFDPHDPYAMSIVFRTSAPVTWTFGRDLLVDGLYEPAGEGDVQVWPCLAEAGTAVVMLELFAPDGAVVLQVPSRVVADFVTRMLHAVPLGAECVDVDAALAALL
jgi:hypothetical protein